MRNFHFFTYVSICALVIIFTAGCSQISSTPTSVKAQDESIVGKWYASSPDELTFQFNADGTFTESGQFGTYHGKWVKVAKNTYDAEIRDGWGAKKQAHFLYNNGQLLTGGIMPLQKI
ncbi:MAG: hypothetical protein PHR49_05720 [Methanoculleus sp.]|jgi:hypothetical protein|nr:hypothetical protein [Methanoculleus sp.]